MSRAPVEVHDALLHQLIYSMIVAGKSASFANQAIARLFPAGAFDLRHVLFVWAGAGSIGEHLRQARTGNYTKLTLGIVDLLRKQIDLATCTASDLEAVHGIGPKTARFFLLWTRPDSTNHAALDVHILRWLRTLGYDAPRQTPSSPKKYAELEAIVLAEAKKRGLSPAQLDAQVWDAGRRAYLEKRGSHDAQHPEQEAPDAGADADQR